MVTKKILILLISFMLSVMTVYSESSILGSEMTNDEGLVVANGTVYTDNIYYSNQSGVGKQHERYYTYTPNENIVPSVYSGGYIYGKQTLKSATNEIYDKGYIPIMGMNAGFFSMKTGIPMSNVIENGIVISKEVEGADAVGFYEDGSAVIDWLSIKTTMTVNDNEWEIHNINKYRQPFGVYLLTDRFYTDTCTSDEGLDVVIGEISGEMRLGETITGVVESVSNSKEAISIPEGKIVLTIADEAITNGYIEIYEMLSALKAGDKISVKNTVSNPEVWNNISYAVGSLGGRLIKNGNILDVSASAAPRTAVGIKEDGSVVFYTIDGRQSSSYGIRTETLAKRMSELGCIQAINMDGGGSTSLSGIMPGDWSNTLLNSPSDGVMRKCANFFVLINKSERTKALSELYIYPYNGYYLINETESFSVKGVDDGHYPADLNAPVTYSIDKGSIDAEGKAVFTESGECTITATCGSLSKSVKVTVVDSPDDMVFQNEKEWNDITSLTLSRGEKAELSAVPFYKHTEHFAVDTLFKWSVESETEGLATIDADGTLITGMKTGKGFVRATFGNCTKLLPITVTDKTPVQNEGNFSDISFEFKDNLLTASFSSKNDVAMKWASIGVDGSFINNNLNGKTLSTELADGKMHKIKVVGDNDLGCKSLAYYTVNYGSSQSDYIDIENHWANAYISYFYEQGLTDYTFETNMESFMPDVNMTRLDLSVLMCKAMKYNLEEYKDFELDYVDEQDIPASCVPYIKALTKEKVINGKGTAEGNIFDPFNTITRAEVATILGRVMPYGIRSGNISATDKADIPDWAISGFNVLSRYKIISGYPDGSVKPKNKITRGECVKMLYEIY